MPVRPVSDYGQSTDITDPVDIGSDESNDPPVSRAGRPPAPRTASSSVGTVPSLAPQTASSNVDTVSQDWQAIYNDRLSRMNAARDPALKAHFQAELDVIKLTLDQMEAQSVAGTSTPAPSGSGSGTTQPPASEPATTQPPASESVTTQPPASEPATTQPPASESVTTQPPASEPATTQPPASESVTAQPPVSESPGIGGDSTLGPGAPPALARFKEEIESASKQSGIPANILGAMIWDESRADPNAPTGGLMQIDPNTYPGLKAQFLILQGKDPNDPGTNILAGALRLKQMVDKFGSLEAGLRGYNSGENGVDPNNLNSIPAGTGDPDYIIKINRFASALASGGQFDA